LCPQALEPFYERFDNDFISLRTAAREILQREDDLNEIVQVRSFFYPTLVLLNSTSCIGHILQLLIGEPLEGLVV
jgi:hypothetical protein